MRNSRARTIVVGLAACMPWAVVPLAHAQMAATATQGDAPATDADRAAWIAARAVPLDDAPAVRAELGRIVAGARVVGIGEATHGSGNVMAARAALTLELLEHHGFDTVLLEAPEERCELLARYVAGEDVDGRSALRDVFYWCWQKEELLAAITALRDWNTAQQAAGSQRRVAFSGFDVYPARRARERAQAILDRLDQSAAAEFRRLADRAAAAPHWTDRDPAWEQTTGEFRAFCDGLGARLRQASGADPAEIDKAVTSCRNCQTSLAYATSGPVPVQRVRDSGMVENVVAHVEGKGRRAVLWAHNGHLEQNDEMLGGMLKARFGDSYVRIGSVLGGGACTALSMSTRTVVRYALAESPEGSLERAWARVGRAGLLDLRPGRWGASAAWLDQELPARHDIGFFEMPAEHERTMYRYARRFEALYFLPTSEPSRPIREWPRGVPMNDWAGDE